MKKVLFLVLVFSSLISSVVMAEKDIITSEDFEKYNIGTVYNSGELTVSYPGMDDATLTGPYIINAPGGIYEGTDVYEGNAADNIVTYAKTSDTTAIAVTGGLNNGWHGAYSHPMLLLQGGQGAESEYNSSNRRLAVVNHGTGKSLIIAPAKSIYVPTFAWYGYDNVDFSKPVVWETDVKIQTVSKGYFELSLTKGKLSEIRPFQYSSHDSGRHSITPFVRFTSDGKITIFGEEAGTYSIGAFYTVSIFIDNTGDSPVYSVTVKEKESQNTVIETEKKALEFDFDGVSGVEYFSNTPLSDSRLTEAIIDNISISHLVFNGVMKSSSAVAINGTGTCLLEFSDAFNEETVNEDSIKVYGPDGTQIEGVQVIVNSTKYHRVQLKFTGIELIPSSTYKVVMKGVKSTDGILCNSEAEFKTADIVSFTTATKTSDGVTFSIRNNANYETSVTLVAVAFKDGKIISDGVYYKKVSFLAKETINDAFTGMQFSQEPDKIRMYVIDGIEKFRALCPQKEL